jgi:hypothetical protein
MSFGLTPEQEAKLEQRAAAQHPKWVALEKKLEEATALYDANQLHYEGALELLREIEQPDVGVKTLMAFRWLLLASCCVSYL